MRAKDRANERGDHAAVGHNRYCANIMRADNFANGIDHARLKINVRGRHAFKCKRLSADCARRIGKLVQRLPHIKIRFDQIGIELNRQMQVWRDLFRRLCGAPHRAGIKRDHREIRREPGSQAPRLLDSQVGQRRIASTGAIAIELRLAMPDQRKLET